MAVRPIDGNELYRIEKLLDTDWVSVYDRLPEPGERVLATDCGFVGEFYINKRGKWQRYNVNCSELLMALDILYWMPLPAPPDKDNHVPAKAPNEPLTLEKLREINGEPIYVTTKNYGDGWCILNWHGVNKSYTYFSRTGTSEGMTATPLSAKTYGDLWLAYRRPLEGEEGTW